MKIIKNLSKPNKKAFIFFFALTVLLIIFIFSNSLKNGEESSSDSEWVSKIVAYFVNFIFGTSFSSTDVGDTVRTLAHFSEFAALGFFLSATIANSTIGTKGFILKALPIAFLIAVIDEIIQIFSDGRAFQLFDIFIDSSGCITGTLFFVVIINIYYKIKKSKERITK